MRKKKVVQAGKCYHLVSSVAHRAFFFDDDEKTRFVDKDAGNPRVRGEEQERAGVGAGYFGQPWLSRACLNPLRAQGYTAQTLPKKPTSPLQRYNLLRTGKDVLV